jgi:hypothetical protein
VTHVSIRKDNDFETTFDGVGRFVADTFKGVGVSLDALGFLEGDIESAYRPMSMNGLEVFESVE